MSEGQQKIGVPLSDYIREAAEASARVVINEHVKTCPVGKLGDRMEELEKRFYLLIGAIIGSGALGGLVGAGVLKLFGA